MKRILIIKGGSQYDQFRYVCDEMMHAFSDLGCLVTMMDLMHIDITTADTDIFTGYDMLFSFNCIGIEIYNSMTTRPFFWTFLVDHPFHHNSRLKQIRGNVMVSCIDRRHVEYIDKYYKNIPWTCFMPHGGLTGESLPQIPYNDRTYNVILMGSLDDPNKIDIEIDKLRKELDVIVSPVIDASLQDYNIDLEALVYDTMVSLGIASDNELYTDTMAVMSTIDRLRRYHKRLSLVNSLTSCGIVVDIWGNGWRNIENIVHNDFILLHDNVSYDEAKHIMRDSRIVLSDMPLFHDGSHERVFAAMQSGAISMSDRSHFLEECFKDGENIIFYDLDKIDVLAKIIQELLLDTGRAQLIIRNALTASCFHTWSDRANAILEITSKINN